MSESPLWARARLAATLLAVDPKGLGGLWLRARPSPVRDRMIEAFAALPLPLRRLHPSIGDEQLFGGVDLTATLAARKVVRSSGLLGMPAALILPMAERATPGLAARLAQALDDRLGHCLICLDESAEEGEGLPTALADRLAFRLDFSDIGLREAPPFSPDCDSLAAAREHLSAVAADADALTDLTRLSHRLEINSLRAPLLALRAAKAHAALAGRETVETADLKAAVELVFAPRATVLPEAETEDEEDEAEPPSDPDTADGQAETHDMRLPEEMLLDAVKAVLPPKLLARMAARKAAKGAKGSGEGAVQKGNRRGRPMPSRTGRLDGVQRIDLIGTLRAAAPWQTVRRRDAPERDGLHVRPADIRTKRYQEKSDRLLIFAVDASGSAALSRLNEAKGAVELLLAEAYTRRDHVALVSFRGTGAELLLPPTRSLVQTKRRLAGLPGGGGTPLAAGLRTALDLSDTARKRGMTPTVILLTDGRANIALDGQASRAAATEDARTLARVLRSKGVPGLVIDMGVRPERSLTDLASVLDAPYIPLPRADAQRLSSAVSTALEA